MLGRLSILLLPFLFTVAATAQPFTWCLLGVTFDDGGTATGCFTYNADTNTYSDINITTTDGSVFNGANYDTVNLNFKVAATGFLVLTSSAPDQTNLPAIQLVFPPLPDRGGTIELGAVEGTCEDALCDLMTPLRDALFSSGSVLGSTETLEEFLLFGG